MTTSCSGGHVIRPRASSTSPNGTMSMRLPSSAMSRCALLGSGMYLSVSTRARFNASNSSHPPTLIPKSTSFVALCTLNPWRNSSRRSRAKAPTMKNGTASPSQAPVTSLTVRSRPASTFPERSIKVSVINNPGRLDVAVVAAGDEVGVDQQRRRRVGPRGLAA